LGLVSLTTNDALPGRHLLQRWKTNNGLPPPQGLYDPVHEHDACGMGFVASIRGEKSHQIIEQGIQILINLTTAAPAGAIPRLGTGRGCSSRFRTSSLRASAKHSASACPSRANMPWA
jgi:glutamate synthase (NADPH/NADH) large chain